MSDSASLTIPLFPLGTVLFPQGMLPLRIFEVRYLDMIGRCHREGRPFGVVALSRGHEVRSRAEPGAQGFAAEAFHDVGTLAHIDALERPQPGLLMIRCTGGSRFRLRARRQLTHGLWMGEADPVPADTEMALPPDLRGVANALSNLINTLHARDVPAQEIPIPTPYRLDDCGWVANRWCELLPLALEQKQGLMALDSPLLRLELASDLLAQSGIGG